MPLYLNGKRVRPPGVGRAYVNGKLVYQAAGGGVVDPEAGLTLTSSHAPDSAIASSTFARTAPVVLAADFTGLDGSAGGLIFEAGGGSVYAAVGFLATGEFVARWFRVNQGEAAVSVAEPPSGDGTLVVELDNVAGTVRVWWQGVLLGEATGTPATEWAGSNNGHYLGTSTSSFGGDIVNAAPSYATASDLRHYANQTVSL